MAKKRDHKTEYQNNLERYGREYFRKAVEKNEAGKRLSRGMKRFGIPGLSIPDNTVTVYFDPDPIGGFRNGSKINGVAECLYIGAFSDGTIVEHRNVKYRVVGLSRQRLELVE